MAFWYQKPYWWVWLLPICYSGFCGIKQGGNGKYEELNFPPSIQNISLIRANRRIVLQEFLFGKNLVKWIYEERNRGEIVGFGDQRFRAGCRFGLERSNSGNFQEDIRPGFEYCRDGVLRHDCDGYRRRGHHLDREILRKNKQIVSRNPSLIRANKRMVRQAHHE